MLFSESLTVLDMSDDVDQQPDDNGKMKFSILKKVDGVHITDTPSRFLHPRFSRLTWPS